MHSVFPHLINSLWLLCWITQSISALTPIILPLFTLA